MRSGARLVTSTTSPGAPLTSDAEKVLGVVEDEEHPPPAQVAGEHLPDVAGAELAESEHVRDGGQRVGGLLEGSEGDEHRAVGEPRLHPFSHREGEASLADPAGSGQRDHSLRREQRGHLVELGRAAHDRGRREGQPRPRRLDRLVPRRSLVRGEAERARQCVPRVRVGPRPGATFQRAHRVGADARPFRQLLLREAGAFAQPAQRLPERLGRTTVHAVLPA
jgi:hypothetical protein